MTGRKAEGAEMFRAVSPSRVTTNIGQTLVLQPPHQAPQLLAS